MSQLVPRLKAVPVCTTVPQEECQMILESPRTIKKPVYTIWCRKVEKDNPETEVEILTQLPTTTTTSSTTFSSSSATVTTTAAPTTAFSESTSEVTTVPDPTSTLPTITTPSPLNPSTPEVPNTLYGPPKPQVPSQLYGPPKPQNPVTALDIPKPNSPILQVPISSYELLNPEDEAGMVTKNPIDENTESSFTESYETATVLSPESKTGDEEKLFDLGSENVTEMLIVNSNEENEESFTTTASLGTTTDLPPFKSNQFSTSENEMIDILYGTQRPEENTEPTQGIRPRVKPVDVINESILTNPGMEEENTETTTSQINTFLDEAEINMPEPRQLNEVELNTNYGAPISDESTSRSEKDPEVQNPSKPDISYGAPTIQIIPSSSEPSTVYGAPEKNKLPDKNLEVSYGSPDFEPVTEMLNDLQRSVDDSNPENLSKFEEIELEQETTTAQSDEETTMRLDFEKDTVETNSTINQSLAKDSLSGPDLRTESQEEISSGYEGPQQESNSAPSTLYNAPERKPELRSENSSGQQSLPFYVTPKSRKIESTFVKPEVVKRIDPASASRGRKLNQKISKTTNYYGSTILFPEPEVVDVKLEISN